MAQEQSEGFYSVLRRSVQQGIASVVGRDTCISVEFYLDSSIAVKDISSYTKSLEKMFGPGSKLIEERCARALYSNMQLDFALKQDYSLNDYVEEAKKLWLTGTTSSRRKDQPIRQSGFVNCYICGELTRQWVR
ncbi:MAG: hypothetical protein ACREBS_12205, partial [Nitrososphaerales archaeon]